MSAHEVFDRAHFDHMTGADRSLQLEVAALFFVQATAWSENACAGWRERVHTLKGAARGIGLPRLALACERAEQSAEGEVAAHLAEISRALAEAAAALQRFAEEL